MLLFLDCLRQCISTVRWKKKMTQNKAFSHSFPRAKTQNGLTINMWFLTVQYEYIFSSSITAVELYNLTKCKHVFPQEWYAARQVDFSPLILPWNKLIKPEDSRAQFWSKMFFSEDHIVASTPSVQADGLVKNIHIKKRFFFLVPDSHRTFIYEYLLIPMGTKKNLILKNIINLYALDNICNQSAFIYLVAGT